MVAFQWGLNSKSVREEADELLGDRRGCALNFSSFQEDGDACVCFRILDFN